jgi:hypothetical protein
MLRRPRIATKNAKPLPKNAPPRCKNTPKHAEFPAKTRSAVTVNAPKQRQNSAEIVR